MTKDSRSWLSLNLSGMALASGSDGGRVSVIEPTTEWECAHSAYSSSGVGRFVPKQLGRGALFRLSAEINAAAGAGNPFARWN
jgi:hypothetical protein